MSKTILIFLLPVLFFVTGISFSQTDFTSETLFDMPGDWGKSENENISSPGIMNSNIPQDLLNAYIQARTSHNGPEMTRLASQMSKYYQYQSPENVHTDDAPLSAISNPPPGMWLGNDILVYSGEVTSYLNYRQMDMKLGDDGWLYLAVNRKNVTGLNGVITVYRSSNGGLNWVTVTGVQSATAYYGSVSMIVDRNHATNNDSVRIILYYNRSDNTSMNDATINFASFRRNGSAFYSGTVAVPVSGQRFVFPSAVSDGQYWDVATYMHVVFREEYNSGTYSSIRHYISYTWATAHAGAALMTSNNDLNPSAAFCWKGGNDSIYIAVERRLTATEHEIRVLTTPEIPVNVIHTYYITGAPSGIRYEMPCITAVQQAFNVPRKILITCTRNEKAVYHYSNNGGSSWTVDFGLGLNTQNVDYTWCNSDSNTASGGYLIASYVDLDGDSVSVRRGVLGTMGTISHKINSVAATSFVVPVCEVYKSGANKYSAVAYVGLGPANVYFDQEGIVGIQNTGTIVSGFELSQNYPNPFNPVTKINFGIPQQEYVILKVFDLLGREVRTIVNEKLQAGSYSVNFDAGNLPSGIYFYKLQTGTYSEVRSMILIK
jgi:hypothetical protein